MIIEDDAYALAHPLRCRIVELLAEKPMHINEIAKALGEERRLVSYLSLIHISEPTRPY